jgi:hypothetical protein
MTLPSVPALARLGAAAALTLLAFSATARDHGAAAAPQLPAYQQECGACHLAFPPGLLPAASWQRLMANLPRHFGTDASLDAAQQQPLASWLAANAGTYRKVARDAATPPHDRISQASWFVREHREVDAATWKRKSIASAANCAACHSGAAQGRFSEHDIRIPQ